MGSALTVLGADRSEECRFATLLVICVAMTSQPGILRFAVGMGEEKLSMSIKRCWRIAMLYWVPRGMSPEPLRSRRPAVIRKRDVPAKPRRYFVKGVTAKTSRARKEI